jgi:hypothetical protein
MSTSNRKVRRPRQEPQDDIRRNVAVRSTVPVQHSRRPFSSLSSKVVGYQALDALARAPVPLEHLEGLSLKVGPIKSPRGTSINGLYSVEPGQHEIALNSKMDLGKVDQVTVHELGHHIAHPALWGRVNLSSRAGALGEALADNYANRVLGPLPPSGYEKGALQGKPVGFLESQEEMDVYRAHRRYGPLSGQQFTDVSQGPLAEKNRKVRRLRP